MTRSRRWQIAIVVTVLLLCATSLLLASRKESRWRVSLEVNWRVFGSDSVEFDPTGRRVRTVNAYHIGPLTVSSERLWLENASGAMVATNKLQSVR
jgi:hypothetical protein